MHLLVRDSGAPLPAPIRRLRGSSPAMHRVRRLAARAARVDVPILLLGETGTGKSMLARAIHEAGPRSRSAYVGVNCAGVPEGLFESEFFGHERGAFTGAERRRVGLFGAADGGTLFLDEVGELSPERQAKLLTVLDEGRVRRVGSDRPVRISVRLVSATSVDPLSGDAGFRRDLYHRLAVLRCRLPPLRERPDDVPELARAGLDALARKHGVARPRLPAPSLELLRSRRWPGNVRELLHVLEAALVLSDGPVLEPELLDRVAVPDGDAPGRRGERSTPATGGRYSFFGSPEEERRRILDALTRARGNRSAAARELGMARNTLRSKMRRYGLEPGAS